MQRNERARATQLLSASLDVGALAPILRAVYGASAAGELPISSSRNTYFDAFVTTVEQHGWDDQIFVQWMTRLRKPLLHAAKVRELAVDLGVSADNLPRVERRTSVIIRRVMPSVFFLASLMSISPCVPRSAPCVIALASIEKSFNSSTKTRTAARALRQYNRALGISTAMCFQIGR